ncbi:hypothetical protein ACFYZ9_24905 [Streptomyces sp. NPDC001691]|uniref:hypothetical protein n=1 Tax=unclassified Streptomyces TaxID=2593676 RepID=UPI0011C07C40|nr:hypothetical protein [Streptomyces sp. SDr-06]
MTARVARGGSPGAGALRISGPLAALTGAVALLAAAGCSGSSQQPAQPKTDAVPRITEASQIKPLPLDAYTLNQQQYLDTLNAQRVLARRCMTQYGIDWHGSDVVDPAPVGQKLDTLFLIIDENRASRYGYHSPDDHSKNGGKSSAGNDPTPVEKSVFTGTYKGPQINGHSVPKGGCSAVVEAELTKGGAPGVGIFDAANVMLGPYQQSKSDSRVLDAFSAWSTCMKDKGYTYKTPDDAVNDPAWRAPQPTSTEIATARADVACKQRTNVVGTWWAVLTAYENKYIDEHAEDLTKVKRQVDATLRNSATILATGS